MAKWASGMGLSVLESQADYDAQNGSDPPLNHHPTRDVATASIHLLVEVSQVFDTALLLDVLGVRNRSNDVYPLNEVHGSIDGIA